MKCIIDIKQHNWGHYEIAVRNERLAKQLKKESTLVDQKLGTVLVEEHNFEPDDYNLTKSQMRDLIHGYTVGTKVSDEVVWWIYGIEY